MKLSSLRNPDWRVLRDGNFASLGLLMHEHAEMLVCLYDEQFLGQLLANPCITAVVTSPNLAEQIPARIALAVSADPMKAFYDLHETLLTSTDFYGAKQETRISPDCEIAEGAFVAPFNVVIGDGCRVARGCQIYPGTRLGHGVNLGPNVILGWDGFEPKLIQARQKIIRHAGGVHLREHVSVLANTNIAKAVFNGSTTVGHDTTIDSLVNISHNVQIGRHCRIAANASIAGSTLIGDEVWIGPGAVVSSGITVHDKSFVAIGAVVTSSIPEGARVAGNPGRIIGRQ